MPTLKNAYTGDLILPDGTAVRRNGPVVGVADDTWAKMLKHPVVKAWVDEGRIALVDEKEDEPEPEPTKDETDPRDPLREEARSLGVEVNMNWGEKRLREEIDKKKPAE